MSVSFENYLVVGISSRALFNLEKENEVFEKEGLDAYRDYQIVHENDVLSPGSGFALVKNLLNINKLANRKLVEVIVMSRNSADTSLRIINSLEHYDMDIGRMVLSGGEDIVVIYQLLVSIYSYRVMKTMYPMRFMQALRLV